jgi:hypothetical protein
MASAFLSSGAPKVHVQEWFRAFSVLAALGQYAIAVSGQVWAISRRLSAVQLSAIS